MSSRHLLAGPNTSVCKSAENKLNQNTKIFRFIKKLFERNENDYIEIFLHQSTLLDFNQIGKVGEEFNSLRFLRKIRHEVAYHIFQIFQQKLP